MKSEDTYVPASEKRYSIVYKIPIPTPTDTESFNIDDIRTHRKEFRTENDMIQFVETLKKGKAECVNIVHFSGAVYEKDGVQYPMAEDVTERYYHNPLTKFFIFEENQIGADRLAERDKVTGKWHDVIIEARTPFEALDIYYETRQIAPEDEWLFSSASMNHTIADETLLKKLGYSDWDDYYDDMHPSRPIEI